MAVEKRVYTPKEVAHILALSVKTVHRMISEGIIESINIGPQTVRISRAKFDKWYQERDQEAESEKRERRNPSARLNRRKAR